MILLPLFLNTFQMFVRPPADVQLTKHLAQPPEVHQTQPRQAEIRVQGIRRGVHKLGESPVLILRHQDIQRVVFFVLYKLICV